MMGWLAGIWGHPITIGDTVLYAVASVVIGLVWKLLTDNTKWGGE